MCSIHVPDVVNFPGSLELLTGTVVEVDVTMENKENIGATPLKTRSSTGNFDWNTQCFICGDNCNPNRDNTLRGYSRSWSLVETVDSVDPDNSIYRKVLDIALQTNDTTIINRLTSVANGDLVAVNARYHRKKGCLTKFYKQNTYAFAGITPPKVTSNVPTLNKNLYFSLAQKLRNEFEHKIMVENNVYFLSTLRDRFIQLANDEGCTSAQSYKSYSLKKLLTSVWPEISFVHHNGKSDLVCSSHKTISEAIREAKQFEQEIQDENDCSYELLPETEPDTDESIVHKAVGILRQRIIDSSSRLENEFYSPEEMTLSAQKEFVDPLLYKAVCWLSDRKYYKEASENTNRKCLAIACDISTLVTSNPSPKHLGLSVHLFNEFNSRHLIEDMYALGYSISYPDLRLFLTSAAQEAFKTQKVTASGGIVPDNILPKDQGGKLVVAVADNWDHNEKTSDGKRTTHAMISILVTSTSANETSIPRLPKATNRTFDSQQLPGGGLCSIVPYRKPSHRPTPVFECPVTIDEIKPVESTPVKIARLKELLYSFGRSATFCDDVSEDQNIPNWSIFSAKTVDKGKQSSVSTIAYNPIIMSKPTDYSTIYTTLLRAKEVMNALGQSHIPVVFDMGLPSKALEIVWSQDDNLKGVIPVEGGMHLLMSIFAGIGFLYGEAGLRQLLSDSGVYAPVTAANILSGIDFDRALMAFKLIDEALYNRLLRNFEAWCETNNKDIHCDVTEMLSKFRGMSNDEYTESSITNFCEIISTHMSQLLDEFRDECRNISPTFLVWDEYLTKVSTPLKLLLSSTRSPNWSVHQHSKLQLMPLLFASNRTTYAKYMTVQILQMNRLPRDVEEAFSEGLFTAKLSTGIFNSVWLDYTLETTQNKDLKGSGGIIGLTMKENALARWFLARPLSSRYSSIFHENIGSTREVEENRHHTDTNSQREQFNKAVTLLTNIFDTNFIDPFDVTRAPAKLVNFATGTYATDDVQKSMTNCLSKGQDMFELFVRERLVEKIDGSDPPEKSFFSPMPRSNVKTMSDKNTKKVQRKKTELINGPVMFQRLLAINTYKKVPSERVFSFENTTVPLSMFTDEGKMIKTKKSDFMKKLEELLPVGSLMTEDADVVIFDGMALVQILTVTSEFVTFSDMASGFLLYALGKARDISHTVKSIHIIFDKYNADSLKAETRHERGDENNNDTNNIHVHVRGELRVPKVWKMFLRSGANKERLIEYYTGYMIEHAYNELKTYKTLFINGGRNANCVRVTTDSCLDVPELHTNQEEADTMMIMHAKYEADRSSSSLVIHSPDTDVLVLLLHHYHNIGAPYVYMSTGRVTIHTDCRRLIPVHKLKEKMTTEQSNIILAIYCITGCDTTSGFYGKGKRKVFKMLIDKAHTYQPICDMGEEFVLTELQRLTCINFVINLYGGNNKQTLHQLRCAKAKSSVHPRLIPPTEDSFRLHPTKMCGSVMDMETCNNASTSSSCPLKLRL